METINLNVYNISREDGESIYYDVDIVMTIVREALHSKGYKYSSAVCGKVGPKICPTSKHAYEDED